MRKKFYSFVVPSMLSLTFVGIYTIVDGYFVGNSVGDDGLTAIGLVYPVVALIVAIGTGIGMGGSILRTISEASGDNITAAKYDRATFSFLVTGSFLCTAAVLLLIDPVLHGIGASGQVFLYGKDYLKIIFLGSIFQMLGAGLPPLIRNHGSASYSMNVMIGGCAANIFFDYLFVMKLDLGVAGAAWATVTGQALAAVGAIWFFIRNRYPVFRPLFNWTMYMEILKTGASSFGITMLPSVDLLLMNTFSVTYGGLPAVTCYTVVAYMTWIVYLILQGIGDGAQPLLSESFGSGNRSAMRSFELMSYRFAVVTSLVSAAVLFVLRNSIGPAFGVSASVSTAVGHTMPILLIGFIPLAYARVTAARLYAVADSGKAALLTYSEFGFLSLLLIVLPRMGGLESVWWSMSLSQLGVGLLAFVLNLHKGDRIPADPDSGRSA